MNQMRGAQRENLQDLEIGPRDMEVLALHRRGGSAGVHVRGTEEEARGSLRDALEDTRQARGAEDPREDGAGIPGHREGKRGHQPAPARGVRAEADASEDAAPTRREPAGGNLEPEGPVVRTAPMARILRGREGDHHEVDYRGRAASRWTQSSRAASSPSRAESRRGRTSRTR